MSENALTYLLERTPLSLRDWRNKRMAARVTGNLPLVFYMQNRGQKWLNEARLAKEPAKQRVLIANLATLMDSEPGIVDVLVQDIVKNVQSSNKKMFVSATSLLDALLSKSERFRAAFFSNSKILNSLASLKHRALLKSSITNWTKIYGSEYPLIEGLIAQLRRRGVETEISDHDESSARADEVRVRWTRVESEISGNFPEIQAALTKLKNLLEIVFPATLAEAFAGLPEIPSSEISDQPQISAVTNFQHAHLDPAVEAELRDALDLVKRKKIYRLRAWIHEISDISLQSSLSVAAMERQRAELREFLEDWEEAESRAMVLLARNVSHTPSKIDSEYEDDF